MFRLHAKKHGEARVNNGYVGVDTNAYHLHIHQQRPAGRHQSMERTSPSRSTRKTIKLGHKLPTSCRPDDFHDTRVRSLVSRHHSTGYRIGTHGIFDRVLAILPRSASIDSGQAVCLRDPSISPRLLFPSRTHVADSGSRSRMDSFGIAVRREALEPASSAWVRCDSR